MKNLTLLSVVALEALALEAMAVALVEDDMRLGFPIDTGA